MGPNGTFKSWQEELESKKGKGKKGKGWLNDNLCCTRFI